MMRITILTMCPDFFGDFRRQPVTQRAVREGRLSLEIVDFRGFADGCFRKVDDSPYGGGAGMIIRCQPVLDALAAVRTEKSHVIALSPAGKPFAQADARRLSREDHLVLVCGHYEGLDERIYDHTDELISIGDYVLTGGELPAMVVTDAVVRLQRGILKEESLEEESFDDGLLEYPQYTRPADFRGQKVPEVLLSGDHGRIRRWRSEEALRRTQERRPDLLVKR